ncbi:MAG: hypothetical protein ABIT38_12940 [Gemmatimonadaceae bacterium]
MSASTPPIKCGKAHRDALGDSWAEYSSLRGEGQRWARTLSHDRF